MGLSTWPDLELFPLEERPLLQAARLRRFGVNYLQDAVCPGLGLLAHLDGSHVRLLAFSSRLGRGGRSDGAGGNVVADIDLEVGHPDNKPEQSASSLRRAGEGGPALATTSQGPARGLSWGRCAASAESGGSSTMAPGPQGGTGGGIGVGAVDVGRGGPGVGGGGGLGDPPPSSNRSSVPRDQRGEIACHLAVACGSEVLLWKVCRAFSRDAVSGSSSNEGAEIGSKKQLRNTCFSAVSVLTDWHRGCTPSNDSSTDERKHTPIPDGHIRCLSFRPSSGAGAGSPAAAGVIASGEEEGVPLTAWYDAGAAVLGSGGSRVVLPAPVLRERACGAWSGCGRRLAVSSGGEIRVFSDPSEENLPSMATAATSGSPDLRPVKAGTAVRGGSDSSPSRGKHGPEVLPLPAEARGGWLAADAETQPQDKLGVVGPEKAFRTALCVEATMYDGGILSSPGSSPGGTPSSLSPSARQGRITPPPPRGSSATCGDRRGPVTSASSAPRTRTESGAPADGQAGEHSPSHAAPSSPVAVAAVSTKGSSSPPLIGNMRAMCPAGPLAFFGTTEGGLGLDSVLVSRGCSTGMSEPSSTGVCGGMTKRGGNDLLGAIVNSSHAAALTAASDAGDDAGGGGVEVPPRRGGFRHVLPGENWLAGSLRPSSRSGPPPLRRRGSGSPESRPDASAPASSPPSGCVPAVPAAGRGTAAAGAAVAEPGASRPMAAPEVLDLRGKLGEGAFGGGVGGRGGAGGASMTSTHPLFRLSLPGGLDPINSPVVGSGSRGSTPNTATAAASARRPWLVRVSCRNRSGGGTAAVGGGGGSGSNSVGVKALASLPPGLASPDLLASSGDGRYIVVGSHACNLVACFRLELSSSEEGSIATDEGRDRKSSSNPVAEGGLTDGGPLAGRGSVGRGGSKAEKGRPQRKRRHRRAVPLCTLRLPPGCRAKGLTVVKEQCTPSARCETSGAAARVSGTGGTAGAPASDAGAEEVVVLVLGGCAVTDAHAATTTARRSSTGGELFPSEADRRRRRSSSSEEGSYRTVLLRYVLPSAPSETNGHGVVRDGEGSCDSGNRGSSSNNSACMRVSGGSNEDCPASTASNSSVEQVERGGGGIGDRVGARRLTPSARAHSSIEENDIGQGDGDRLEAIVMKAVAGAERRMGDRLDRMEKMLVGVCNRLGVLEDAVRGQPLS